jgi:phosphohistidine phosphatase
MKTLILMRHAEAASQTQGQSDFGRSLTEAGRIMATKTGELLGGAVDSVDQILASGAVRTTETAQLIHDSFPKAEIAFRTELYQAHAHEYLSLLRATGSEDDATRILIAHNPTIAHLMCSFAGLSLSVPPSTAAVIELQISDWSALRSDLPQNASRLVTLIRDGRRVT